MESRGRSSSSSSSAVGRNKEPKVHIGVGKCSYVSGVGHMTSEDEGNFDFDASTQLPYNGEHFIRFMITDKGVLIGFKDFDITDTFPGSWTGAIPVATRQGENCGTLRVTMVGTDQRVQTFLDPRKEADNAGTMTPMCAAAVGGFGMSSRSSSMSSLNQPPKAQSQSHSSESASKSLGASAAVVGAAGAVGGAVAVGGARGSVTSSNTSSVSSSDCEISDDEAKNYGSCTLVILRGENVYYSKGKKSLKKPYIEAKLSKNKFRMNSKDVNGDNCFFGDSFVLPYSQTKNLKLSVYDDLNMKKDPLLGSTTIDLTKYLSGDMHEIDLPIAADQSVTGHLFCLLKMSPENEPTGRVYNGDAIAAAALGAAALGAGAVGAATVAGSAPVGAAAGAANRSFSSSSTSSSFSSNQRPVDLSGFKSCKVSVVSAETTEKLPESKMKGIFVEACTDGKHEVRMDATEMNSMGGKFNQMFVLPFKPGNHLRLELKVNLKMKKDHPVGYTAVELVGFSNTPKQKVFAIAADNKIVGKINCVVEMSSEECEKGHVVQADPRHAHACSAAVVGAAAGGAALGAAGAAGAAGAMGAGAVATQKMGGSSASSAASRSLSSHSSISSQESELMDAKLTGINAGKWHSCRLSVVYGDRLVHGHKNAAAKKPYVMGTIGGDELRMNCRSTSGSSANFGQTYVFPYNQNQCIKLLAKDDLKMKKDPKIGSAIINLSKYVEVRGGSHIVTVDLVQQKKQIHTGRLHCILELSPNPEPAPKIVSEVLRATESGLIASGALNPNESTRYNSGAVPGALAVGAGAAGGLAAGSLAAGSAAGTSGVNVSAIPARSDSSSSESLDRGAAAAAAATAGGAAAVAARGNSRRDSSISGSTAAAADLRNEPKSNVSCRYGAFDIDVVKVADLKPTKSERIDTLDPYVKMRFAGTHLTGHCVKDGGKTCDIGDKFHFPYKPYQYVRIDVFDKAHMARDPLVASCKINMDSFVAGTTPLHKVKVPLTGPKGQTDAGAVFLKIHLLDQAGEGPQVTLIPGNASSPANSRGTHSAATAAAVGAGTAAGAGAAAAAATRKDSLTSSASSSSHGETPSAVASDVKSIQVNVLDVYNLKTARGVKTDPYVMVRCGEEEGRTHTAENNEGSHLCLDDTLFIPYSNTKKLKVTVFDNKKMSKDPILGYAKIDCDTFITMGEKGGVCTCELFDSKTLQKNGTAVTFMIQPRKQSEPRARCVKSKTLVTPSLTGCKYPRDQPITLRNLSFETGPDAGSLISSFEQLKYYVLASFNGQYRCTARAAVLSPRVSAVSFHNALEFAETDLGTEFATVQVYAAKPLGADELLGEAQISVADLIKQNLHEKPFRLPVGRGTLLGRVCIGATSIADDKLPTEVQWKSINLSVNQLLNLNTKHIKSVDPYVQVQLGHNELRSDVFEKASNNVNIYTTFNFPYAGERWARVMVFDDEGKKKDHAYGECYVDLTPLAYADPLDCADGISSVAVIEQKGESNGQAALKVSFSRQPLSTPPNTTKITFNAKAI